VPSLGTREVLAFGEGVALSTRLRFPKCHRISCRARDNHRLRAVGLNWQDTHFVTAVLGAGAALQRDNRDAPAIPASARRSVSSPA
jgi:hypothetical protein